jgi:hypothetical protein
LFDAAMGPTGGIPGAEVWIFAGDDARGEPGATIVAADGIEGRLSGGERYTALTTDIRGQARFTAVANRYKGSHKITIAYPGSYAALKDAKVTAFQPVPEYHRRHAEWRHRRRTARCLAGDRLRRLPEHRVGFEGTRSPSRS